MSGHIVFTFVDHDANEFVTLGRTPTEQPDRLAERFAALRPPNDPDSPFLADLWSDGEYHDDDKAVSAEEIEAALGEPLDVLLARGRAEIAALQAEIRRRRFSRPTSGGEHG